MWSKVMFGWFAWFDIVILFLSNHNGYVIQYKESSKWIPVISTDLN